MKPKAVALIMVISVILMVSALTVVVVKIISSQSRLTHHQVSRVQAIYASQAGLVYALEMLRLGPGAPGGWDETSCPAAVPCYVDDDDFPNIISDESGDTIPDVTVVITPNGGPGSTHQVSVTANYTYP